LNALPNFTTSEYFFFAAQTLETSDDLGRITNNAFVGKRDEKRLILSFFVRQINGKNFLSTKIETKIHDVRFFLDQN
jgi:hypothetical protein